MAEANFIVTRRVWVEATDKRIEKVLFTDTLTIVNKGELCNNALNVEDNIPD